MSDHLASMSLNIHHLLDKWTIRCGHCTQFRGLKSALRSTVPSRATLEKGLDEERDGTWEKNERAGLRA